MKKILLIMLLFTIGSCGFSPVYKNNSELQGNLKDVSIDVKSVTTDTKYSVIMQSDLQRKFNSYGLGKKYDLRVTLQEPVRIRKAIQKDDTALLSSVKVMAGVQLIDNKTGNVEISTNVEKNSSFNMLNEIYAADVSYDYAVKQIVLALSDDIYKRVLIFYKSKE